MEKLFSIVGYIIVSLGGGAIIVGGLSSWFGNIWAQRMLKKFDIESQNKLYSSQLQFEREYAIYSKLWKSLFLMKNSTLNLFPVLDYLPEDEDKKMNCTPKDTEIALTMYILLLKLYIHHPLSLAPKFLVI